MNYRISIISLLFWISIPKSGDVSAWLKQAHLAKELLKLNDLAVLTYSFVSRLDGPAFAVYDQLKVEDKKSSDSIESALRVTFAGLLLTGF